MSTTGLTQAVKALVDSANANVLNCFCEMSSVNSTFNRNGSTFGSKFSFKCRCSTLFISCPSCQKTWPEVTYTACLSDSRFQGMSMSPLEAWECRFSKSHPALVSTFSLLSSSWSSDPDLLLRRSPGSLCVGIWKLEKELPNDGLFSKNSTNTILQKMKWVNV